MLKDFFKDKKKEQECDARSHGREGERAKEGMGSKIHNDREAARKGNVVTFPSGLVDLAKQIDGMVRIPRNPHPS